MNYTDEQFAALAPFEDNFRTAIDGEWTRRVRTPDQLRIKDIYEAATKSRIPFNQGCGTCLLNLLKRAGRLYFADKTERDAKAKFDAVYKARVAEIQAKHESEQKILEPMRDAIEASQKIGESIEKANNAARKPQISAQKPRAGKPSAKSNKGRKSAKK